MSENLKRYNPGLYEVKAQCNLVLPVMVNGDLKAWLLQRKQFKLETSLEDKISLLTQAVKGITAYKNQRAYLAAPVS